MDYIPRTLDDPFTEQQAREAGNRFLELNSPPHFRYWIKSQERREAWGQWFAIARMWGRLEKIYCRYRFGIYKMQSLGLVADFHEEIILGVEKPKKTV